MRTQASRLVDIDDIFYELKRAEELHPCWPENIFEQLAILGEEFGELQKAAIDNKHKKSPFSDIRIEAIQTAAMAIRFILSLDEQKK